MYVGIFDDGLTLTNPEFAFPQLQQLRVQVLRINLRWGGAGGVALHRPANAADPADPAYDWSVYDRAVVNAERSGVKILFTIYATPSWANGNVGVNHAPSSSTDLRRFAYAAAKRYSGSFHAKDGTTLPSVHLWLAWNEPNNPVFLKPQFTRAGGKWIYQAAIDYTRICTAIYSGVHATTIANEKVGCGATNPRGNNDPSSTRPSISPLAFLRALKKAGLTHFDAYAHHPYYGNRFETPTTVPRRTASGKPPDVVTLANIQALVTQLTELYGNKRLWITEYGYQTNPPDRFFGVTWAQQATYLSQSFALARRNPRIDMMLWFLLQDEPNVAGWQSGLFTATGARKPAYAAFQALPH